MYSIYKKELRQFFGSIIGYVVIILYLAVNGIVLWVFPDSSIIDYGYATLEQYFFFAPWLLMFLISAITMRMFSDEFRSGNIEILNTLPLKNSQIIGGKFLASLTLIIISILPTLVYILSISNLSYLPNSVDYGSMFGSFIGLLFLSSAFTSIGIFCSSISQNQIVSFLFSLVLCLFFYMALDAISGLKAFENGTDFILQQIGMAFHYNNINKGVLDSRDVFYFLSFVILFLFLTNYALESRKWEKTISNDEEIK